jgi:hypothetical protein
VDEVRVYLIDPPIYLGILRGPEGIGARLSPPGGTARIITAGGKRIILTNINGRVIVDFDDVLLLEQEPGFAFFPSLGMIDFALDDPP